MDSADKIAILDKTFQSLVASGRVRTKQDFADLLGVNRSGLSAAWNGNEKYLTDSLISKVVSITEATELPLPKETILVIPTGARAGTLGDFADTVSLYDCERIVSPIKGADYAMQVTGDSMSPEYPSGSQVIIKRVNESAFIEWGKVYVLDTENGAVIKQIRRTDRDDIVECVSLNPAYQPFTINTSYIKGWYRVLMVLALK